MKGKRTPNRSSVNVLVWVKKRGVGWGGGVYLSVFLLFVVVVVVFCLCVCFVVLLLLCFCFVVLLLLFKTLHIFLRLNIKFNIMATEWLGKLNTYLLDDYTVNFA